MKTINYISTKKIGAGHFEVNVYGYRKCLGSFKTNDASLVDDISEIDNGFESELMGFETFEELKNFCLSKIKKTKQ
jgi:hypothetical protein